MDPLRPAGTKWLPLLLIIAVLFLFWPALLHPFHILHPTFSPFSDTMVIHWPKAHLMAQSRQAGEGLPLWTPLILSGMPLAANQLAMLFYPPAWLFLIFPIEPIFNLLSIFHLGLGGFGIYLLLREGHKLSPTAALLGGLTYALNGKWLAHIAGGHMSMAGAIAWMPWVLFGLMMLFQRRSAGWEMRRYSSFRQTLSFSNLKWVGLVAVALAMQIVTHTLILIYSIYLIGAAVLWHFISVFREGGWKDTKTELRRLILPLLLIPILAGLLGAVQLLPLLELVEFSNRSLSLDQAQEYSATLTQLLVGLLLPSAQGGHELVIYLGLIPLLLVPIGLTRRNRWTWFYGGLLIFTILFALGPSTPVHSLFYNFIPGFRWVRTPARMFFVGSLATSVLVGFAVEQLAAAAEWSAKAQQMMTRLAVGLGALALLLGLGLAFAFGQTTRAAFALAIFVPAGLALMVLQVRRTISPRLFALLLGLLLFLDLALFDMSMMKFLPLEEAIAPGQPVAKYLVQKPGPFRSYSPSYSLPVQTAAAYNLHQADGVEPVHLAIYDQYMARAGGYNDSSFSVTIPNFGGGTLDEALQDTEPNLKLLGLLNVEYLASAFPMDWPGLSLDTDLDGTYIYINELALPRARVVHQTVLTEPDWITQLESMPDLANVATIEASPQLNSTSPASSADIVHFSADRIEIETAITEPGWLVISEIWYPGWRATVNGSLQRVEKVNGMLRGLYLEEPGQYQISIEYRPGSVIWGGWVAGITAGLLVLASIWSWSRYSAAKP